MEVRAEKLGMVFHDAGEDVRVFHDLNLSIPSGQSLAVVGESGVGKTTFLSILGGLERPTEGEVFYGGESLSARYENDGIAEFRGKHLGFIFQFHHLLPEFDAVENVAMPLLLRGVKSEEAKERAVQLLERVRLGHRLHHRPGALSGGEQQRVAIARALCGRPGVILADEPTGNLDVHTAADVCRLLLELQREEKTTLVVVTHSLELAGMLDRKVELTSDGFVERQ